MVAMAIAVAPAAAQAEVGEITIPLGAGGFGFLPLNMMQKYNLIEKCAEEAGLKVTVNWPNIGGPAVMNDALLSGSAQFISAGPPGFLTLWDRTRSSVGVKSIAAISSMPMKLNVRVAQLKSLDDIAPNQKIGSPRSRCRSPPSSCSSMRSRNTAATRSFRFDPNTVTMAHPDALIALIRAAAPSSAIGPPRRSTCAS